MRITNHIRDDIRAMLLNRRNKTLRKAMDERERDLAFRMYRSVVSEAVEKKADALNKDVPGMCKVGQSIYVSTGYRSGYLLLDTSRPQPNGLVNIGVREKDEFFDEAEALLRQKSSWSKEHDAASAQAKAMLAKFKTPEALYAGWPEIASIAKTIIDEAIAAKQAAKERQAIMCVPTELNATFALPADETEEMEAA